jgi:hypothetical protein
MQLRLVCVGLLAACGGNAPPEIHGLEDQVAAVGTELQVRIDGTDADGDGITYGVHADISLQGGMMTQDPSGMGLFRWTPFADDLGVHAFDFTASDGSDTTTVTIQIDVRSANGAVPIFRRPLGSGTTVAPGACANVEILIEDQDTVDVTIAEEAPGITGAMLDQVDGQSGTWMWCPTSEQIAAQDRYTLVLSADDLENPKTIKEFILVVRSGGNGKLVINEVDYDNVGIDTAEFVEIFNPSAAPVSLAGLAVVLVNGSNQTEYDRVDLSPAGSLAPGDYLVISGSGVSVPASAKHIDPVWTQDQIQNGAPDGVALVDTVTHTVLDAISYEGSIAAATLTDFPATVSLVEGTPTGVADSSSTQKSLCRLTNGGDTDNAATDWGLCATPTPGAANSP